MTLSLADLFRPSEAPPELPMPPEAISSFDQLPPEQQARVRQEMILGALSNGLSQFDQGTMGSGLLQGALAGPGLQQGAIDQANYNQDQRYRREFAVAERSARLQQGQRGEAERRSNAEASLAAYQRVAEVAGQDDPDLVAQAEAAARAGDLGTLQKLVAQAPQRVAYLRSMRGANVDPNDPLAVQRYQDDQELEKYKKKLLAQAEIEKQFRPPGSGVPAPREGQLVTGADGNMYLVDQVSGNVRPISLPGGGPMARPGVDVQQRLWIQATNLAIRENQQRMAREQPPVDVNARAQEIMSMYLRQPGGGAPTAPPASPLAPLSSKGVPVPAPQAGGAMEAEFRRRMDALRARGLNPTQLQQAETELRRALGMP